jgi:hypothetical protein
MLSKPIIDFENRFSERTIDMAIELQNWRRGREIGYVTIGAVKQLNYQHTIVTTDDASAFQAGGALNILSAYMTKGDQIDATLDVDATPVRKSYVVTSATGAATVVIALQTTT